MKKKVVLLIILLIILSLSCNALISNRPTEKSTETNVKLTLVTGNDGTEDNPKFELFDNTGTLIYSTILNNPSDFQPGKTDIYEFLVPKSFCNITGFKFTKPKESELDDTLILSEITIDIDGNVVYMDRSLSTWGVITFESNLTGNWADVSIYKQKCNK